MNSLLHLLTCLGSLLLLSRLINAIASRIGIPSVTGEIFLGMIIGPTLLGSLFPELSAWLLPSQGVSGEIMQTISHLVVMLLLFVAGLETELTNWWPERKTIGTTVLGSFFVPMALGILCVFWNPGLFAPQSSDIMPLALFVGLAFGISALPVIIRVLMDLNLYHGKMGTITVAAASIMDILGWVIFALLLCGYHFVSFQETDKLLWSHSTLLSFIIGAVVGNSGILPKEGVKQVLGSVVALISPLFFIQVGASANFVAHLNLELTTAVILFAFLSKLIGTFLGGKLGGLGNREALAIGFALNVRGAMEIILSKQALEMGLIKPDLFIALVILALLTSLCSASAIQLVIRASRPVTLFRFVTDGGHHFPRPPVRAFERVLFHQSFAEPLGGVEGATQGFRKGFDYPEN